MATQPGKNPSDTKAAKANKTDHGVGKTRTVSTKNSRKRIKKKAKGVGEPEYSVRSSEAMDDPRASLILSPTLTHQLPSI
jgi:hypothetical protein